MVVLSSKPLWWLVLFVWTFMVFWPLEQISGLCLLVLPHKY